MQIDSKIVDTLVIGGGPAGSTVAIKLAQTGRHVMLVEKERNAHHKVCGEFLSHEAVEYLRQAGISPLDLGATPIHFVRLSTGSRSAEAQLPFRALSVSRLALDEALLVRAVRQGCDTMRGVSVDRLHRDGDRWRAQLSNGQSISAHTIFLANGKHDLRGWNRGRGVQHDMVGFKLHWRLGAAQTQQLRECMELFLFPGGYGGVSLVENEIANLCFVVRQRELHRMGTWWRILEAAMNENRRLHRLLDGARYLWARPLAISPIPYGYLATQPCSMWRVGDQAAVIPSFTGDGMSIALHSANLAAQMYLAGENAETYTHALRVQLGRNLSLATWLSRAMVTQVGRSFAAPAAALFPNAVRWIATSTRIPPDALLVDVGL